MDHSTLSINVDNNIIDYEIIFDDNNEVLFDFDRYFQNEQVQVQIKNNDHMYAAKKSDNNLKKLNRHKFINIERRRRMELNRLFEELKKELPIFFDQKERVTKNNILREAIKEIEFNCQKFKKNHKLSKNLIKKNKLLQTKLKNLRK